jgi:hypothetical protein
VNLSIDNAATALTPSESDIRTWADEQRVFISSVMASLATERRVVAAAIRDLGAEPVWFEEFGGRDDDAQVSYLGEVATSSIYLGILGQAYGRLMKSRLSATHEEYREAERLGLRMSIWVSSKEDLQGDQQSFVEEVRLFHTTGSYSTPDDLASGVSVRLRRMAAEDLSPWTKLGDSIFRAQEIKDDGKTISIKATIYSPEVVAALESLRPGAWAGKRECRITYNGESYPVRIRSVQKLITNSRGAKIEVAMERAPDLQKPDISVSFSIHGETYSADDVTKINLRRVLLGEQGPRGVLMFGRKMDDPLAQMPRHQLPHEVHSAVVGLLITEALVGLGGASRVTRIRVTPQGPGDGRRISLSWIGTTRSTAPAQSRSIEGHLLDGS